MMYNIENEYSLCFRDTAQMLDRKVLNYLVDKNKELQLLELSLEIQRFFYL